MISPDDPRVQEIIDGAESKAQAINGLFDLGMTKLQIMKLGFKEATVRKEVDRRKREGEDIPGTPPHETPVLPAVTKGTEQVLPEYLSGEISEYFDGSEEQRRIFKAGIMVPLMGMRLFAEMVKPLTMLINAMKGDQVESTMKAMALGQQQASDAAIQASEMTASRMVAAQKEVAIASSPNPVQAMMAKWVSRLYALMAEEIRQNFIWRHGTKWLEEATRNNAIGNESSAGNKKNGNKKKASELSLQAGEGDYGAIECPECQTPIGIGPTTRTAICVGCEAQFDIVRIPAGAEESGVVHKETSVVKNIPPIIHNINDLTHYAKGYAHLELIYNSIGAPFDSTYMDMLLMSLSEVIPDPDEEASLLPYLAFGIQDIKDLEK